MSYLQRSPSRWSEVSFVWPSPWCCRLLRSWVFLCLCGGGTDALLLLFTLLLSLWVWLVPILHHVQLCMTHMQPPRISCQCVTLGLTGRAAPCNTIPQSQPRPRCGSWIEDAECSVLACRYHTVIVLSSSLTPAEDRLWINNERNPSGET